jgi:hypothetical protein
MLYAKSNGVLVVPESGGKPPVFDQLMGIPGKAGSGDASVMETLVTITVYLYNKGTIGKLEGGGGGGRDGGGGGGV